MPLKRPSIVATLGPSSYDAGVLEKMIENGMDVARLNLSWGPVNEHAYFTETVRGIAKRLATRIPIVFDLSGPRVQEKGGHHFDTLTNSVITVKDREDIVRGTALQIEYFALSYVGKAADVEELRSLIREAGGSAKIIAKIERKIALEHAKEIIAAADVIMVARGDLGNEVPLAEIPFDEMALIQEARDCGKPIIVATDMMPSMLEHPQPARSDVTDVAFAAMQGADAVMLSNETTNGKYPVETVSVMRAVLEETAKRGFVYDIRAL